MPRSLRLAVLARIDRVAAEHQEVHAHRDLRQFDQIMLAPASECLDLVPHQPRNIDLRIAGRRQDRAPLEPGELLSQQDDRRAFGHTGMTARLARQSQRPTPRGFGGSGLQRGDSGNGTLASHLLGAKS